ncbi:SDR family NAD(P)-dependent oxidoreductase [Streptomyces sp. NBC_00414]|uniref:SDR family NAD(P)-dependent oxidoreductase n=1 Tax=Streptomyces sp. NBC_00414 TaxID=2975739 RepID=UPI003FA7A1FE
MTASKTALVTGANKGIGYQIAAELGTLGHSVGAGTRDRTRRDEAVADCARRASTPSVSRWTSPTTAASPREGAELIAERVGRLDALVNNAGSPAGSRSSRAPSTPPSSARSWRPTSSASSGSSTPCWRCCVVHRHRGS